MINKYQYVEGEMDCVVKGCDRRIHNHLTDRCYYHLIYFPEAV